MPAILRRRRFGIEIGTKAHPQRFKGGLCIFAELRFARVFFILLHQRSGSQNS